MLTQDRQSVTYDFISGEVQLPAGQVLKLETTPDGEELASFDAGEDDYTVRVYLRFIKNV